MKHLQFLANAWARRAFGANHITNSGIRALRLLEKAIELAQAEGIQRHMVDHCTAVVYGRPIGSAHQEIGGVLMTSAVYCSCNGLDMETVLRNELDRVLAKPLDQFAQRNQDKIDLGLTL